jgi:lysophospholipase L1-like esterase
MAQLGVPGGVVFPDVVMGVKPAEIVLFGDSLTFAQIGVNVLQNLLGTGWSIRNSGISGNTTAMMRARFTLDAQDSSYVILWGGINDLIADRISADIETDLQAMYSEAKAAGKTVVGLTITPFKNHAVWSAARQAECDLVNAWILGAAIDIDYRLNAFALLENPAVADTLLPFYSGDWLHLSADGYSLIQYFEQSQIMWVP